MNEETIAGKTVAGISYPNPWDEGFSILFTDGTVLNVRELRQAGQIVVTYNGQEVACEEGGEV